MPDVHEVGIVIRQEVCLSFIDLATPCAITERLPPGTAKSTIFPESDATHRKTSHALSMVSTADTGYPVPRAPHVQTSIVAGAPLGPRSRAHHQTP